MLREIKTELGFDSIELGHGTRLSLVPGIQKMFDSGQVRFTSLHNFCPLPVEVMVASPDCYQLSAVSPEERERAVKQTFQTIDFAERLGAPFVVLHLGAGENAANYRSIDQDDKSGQASLSRIRTSETESGRNARTARSCSFAAGEGLSAPHC